MQVQPLVRPSQYARSMEQSPDLAGATGADWAAPAATGPLRALIRAPGSKSMTNRALVLAALAAGPTLITGPLRARDTDLMAAALAALGTTVARAPADPGGWLVTPGLLAPGQGAPPVAVDVGNAGTVLRFVPPVATLAGAVTRFTGDRRASQRPVRPLLDALRELGADIDDGGRAAVPFTVRGHGGLPGGRVTLDASASSQLVSGLLLAAPRYDKGVEVRHEGPQVPSAPHIAMTVAMLRAAGAQVEEGGRRGAGTRRRPPVVNSWRVNPGALAPRAVDIEPDLSNAVPFLAAALVAGGSVTIAGWPARSLQPAGRIIDALTAMGGECVLDGHGLTVTGSGAIRGITADLRDVSELTPVLAALAALGSSPSRFTGIGHQRGQDSDRLAALAAELGALGGQVSELDDGLAVTPRPLRAGAGPFASHDDHRLVMAAAVLGLAVPGLRVRDAATVGKTYPGFTRAWARMLEHRP
jgi:3-phosphoshikimate 1-carboxyvinyltransferase